MITSQKGVFHHWWKKRKLVGCAYCLDLQMHTFGLGLVHVSSEKKVCWRVECAYCIGLQMHIFTLGLVRASASFSSRHHHGVGASSGGRALSGCCSPLGVGHPRAVCLRRWGVADPAGSPPCPESLPLHCRWWRKTQPRGLSSSPWRFSLRFAWLLSPSFSGADWWSGG